MSLEKQLQERSQNKCELCNATANLGVYEVPPVDIPSADNSIYV